MALTTPCRTEMQASSQAAESACTEMATPTLTKGQILRQWFIKVKFPLCQIWVKILEPHSEMGSQASDPQRCLTSFSYFPGWLERMMSNSDCLKSTSATYWLSVWRITTRWGWCCVLNSLEDVLRHRHKVQSYSVNLSTVSQTASPTGLGFLINKKM